MAEVTIDQEFEDELAEQATIQLAVEYYDEYLEYVHRGAYTHMAHTLYIADVLQTIADGTPQFIILEVPPRHSKSMTVTESFPSYYLGKYPDNNVMIACHNKRLAKRFGRSNRDKFREYGPQLFDQEVSEEQFAASDWRVKGRRGGLLAAGRNGDFTGDGAHLLIIDDPIRNKAEALSPTIRETIWNEWEATLSSRLQDGASVIVIMTRWHEDDLVGRLIEHSPRPWHRIKIPALAEDDDLLGREPGEPLAPELGYDLEWAEIKRQEVGESTWAALYQQNPVIEGGNIIKDYWLQYCERLPDLGEYDEIIMSMDASFKGKANSDFVAIGILGRKGPNIYLMDLIHDRLDFPASLGAVRDIYHRYPQAYIKLVENKANGPAIVASLEDEIPGFVEIEPWGDKVARTHAVTPIFEGRNFYIPYFAPWKGKVVHELTAFPAAPNDDIVDMITQALNRFKNEMVAQVDAGSPW